MNPMTRTVAGVLSALLMVASSPPAQAKIIDRIVAVVDDEIVTLSELEDAAEPLLRQAAAVPDPVLRAQQKEKRLRQVLDELVGTRLIRQEARKRKLTVSQAEIDEHIASVKQQQGWNDERLSLYLTGQGLTVARFHDEVRDQLLQRKVIWRILGDRIRISDGDLREFYKEKRTQANVDFELEAAHILLRIDSTSSGVEAAAIEQQARELFARAAAGESFEELARKYSDGPSARSGGYLGPIRRGTLDPDFERIAFDLAPGSIGGPVRTRFGFHVIKAIARKHMPAPEFDEIEPQLRRELQERKRSEVMRKWIEELKEKAFIETRI